MDSPFLTIKELAVVLRCSPKRIRGGYGPEPSPCSKRPLLWHKDDVEQWLSDQRIYSESPDRKSGGSGSGTRASSTVGPLEKQIADELWSELDPSAQPSSGGKARG